MLHSLTIGIPNNVAGMAPVKQQSASLFLAAKQNRILVFYKTILIPSTASEVLQLP